MAAARSRIFWLHKWIPIVTLDRMAYLDYQRIVQQPIGGLPIYSGYLADAWRKPNALD